MTLKRKILVGAGVLTWAAGAVGVIRLEAETPVHQRDRMDDTRTKRVAMVVFNPLLYVVAAGGTIYDKTRGLAEDIGDTLHDFWRQPS
jgi:hypothetical protein